ncbi:ABC transporter ATP-binding protein [Myxococcus eversor]|uniref:ABC transporter ATP-binding protein n=1 Tax=Myxococcus eversor TaxID=2709661 RepID=UPI0013D13E8D|nr:ABC transporter ATP-binding protein [Myxococcus eversor]
MSNSPDVDVSLEDVRRAFGAAQALKGVSLAVHTGEVYGLVGPDGAGKTTAIRLMAGLLLPDAGRVRMLGEDPADTRSSVRESLGLVPQRNTLYGDLSVDENLRFFSRLFGLSNQDFAERRERLLDITRLGRFTDRRADALSGGMYKKLALACALLHRPRVLLLDEPTNGVDPVSRRELWELLYGLVHEGMTLLVSTPYMDEAARCHRVGLLYSGELIAEGDPRELARQHGAAASNFEAVFLALVEKRDGGRAA